MTINCEYVQDRLGLLQDGSLDPAEERGMRRHIDDCADCRREADLMIRTLGALDSLEPVPVPEGFRRDLCIRLRGEAALIPARRAFRRQLAMAASLALCAGLAVGVVAGWGLRSDTGAPMQAGLPRSMPREEVLRTAPPISTVRDIRPASARPEAVPEDWEYLGPAVSPTRPRGGGARRPVYYLGGVEAGGESARDYFLDPNLPDGRKQKEEGLPAVVRVSF